MSRRLCGWTAMAMVLVVGSWATPGSAGEARSYVSGNSFLVLDGANCGVVKSVDGGAVSAEVINEAAGPDYFVRKHIGQPKYEDFTIQVGFSGGKPLYDWIAASWKRNYQRKNGSIIDTDYNLTPTAERQFTNALIAETTIPAMDASSKEPAYLTVRIAPELIRSVQPQQAKATGAAARAEQKLFLPANFRLEIAGLDCTKVNKIDSFTVKQTVQTTDIGDARDQQREPGKLEFPNLRITMAESAAKSWKDWHEDFVIKGNNDQNKEKSGTLVLLSPNRATELARIKFYNMGIIRISPDAKEATADSIRRVTVDLYVERMEFEVLAGPAAEGQPAQTNEGEASAAAPAAETDRLAAPVGTAAPTRLRVNRLPAR